MKIAVIDSMGGGIGAQIVQHLKREFPDNNVSIIALGANSLATSKMLKAGAEKGATGENAIDITIKEVDIIAGPIGIIIPHSMMGEITPRIAESIALAKAKKYLLCINQPHVELIGIDNKQMAALIKELIDRISETIKKQISFDNGGLV